MPKVTLIHTNREYIVSIPAREIYSKYEKFEHAYTHLAVLFDQCNYYNQKVILYQEGKLSKKNQRSLDYLVEVMLKTPPMPFA